MRILYVHNDYEGRSGEEHAAEAIAALLKSHGHDVFWFRRSPAKVGTSLTGKVKAFFAGIHNPFAARALGRALDEIRPDLVQVQNIYPWLSPSIFRPIKDRGIPTVMRCPNYRLFCPNGLHLVNGKVCERCLGIGREAWCVVKNCESSFCKSTGYALRNAWARISGTIVRNVSMFIVQSVFQKRKFAERGIPESRIGIVPGLVSPDGLAEPQEHGNWVTFVGRVSPEKGIEDFLAAARLLPGVPFAVAGSNNGMLDIRDRSPASVCWLGHIGSNRLQDVYRRSRIIVVPSRCYESFPNSLVEAMARGRPVVASRIGVMPSIVDDRVNGLLFEVGNPRDLAEKLKILYQDQTLCRELGEAGRNKALAQYSPKSVYAALATVYEEALRNNGRRR
jgi:glycosyltransferase involved in cell wall biosynthesis